MQASSAAVIGGSGASAATSVHEPLGGHRAPGRSRGGDLEAQRGAFGRLEVHHLDGVEPSPERDLALAFPPVVVGDRLAPDSELGAVVGGEIEGVERVVRYMQQPRETNAVLLRALVAAESDLGNRAHP